MIKYVALLFFILILNGCDEDSDESIYYGHAEAKINDVIEWESSVRSTFMLASENNTLIFLDVYDAEFLVNELVFRHIPFQVGSFSLFQDNNSSCSEGCVSFTTGHNDILGDLYNCIEQDLFDDWFAFDSINHATNEYWASFQGSFSRDTSYSVEKWGDLPDTLYFKQGSIYGKLVER